MDSRIKELIDYTFETFGLGNYHLYSHRLYRSVNYFNETTYTLSMEWFPLHNEEREEEDLNPEGTACIDIDVHARQFKSVIFVGGITYAERPTFPKGDKHHLIHWIENETGLLFNEQFKLIKAGDRKYQFQGCVDGIAVSPYGMIDVELNEEGKLTLFSIDGHFPTKESVQESPFVLTLENVESFVKQQLKCIELPSDEKQQLVPVYAIEEIYVTNDQQSAIPFEPVVDRRLYCINKMMHWQSTLEKAFEERTINVDDEVTPEQAFSCEPHPDSFLITKDEQEKCILAVETCLRQVYPNDCGKWIFKTLHRQDGYIVATLRHAKSDNQVFRRKLQVILDAKSFEVLNYIDNEFLNVVYENFQEAEKVKISRDEAYDIMKTKIKLTPVYVYDFQQNKYIMCGKIDSQYGVHAGRGQLILLNSF